MDWMLPGATGNGTRTTGRLIAKAIHDLRQPLSTLKIWALLFERAEGASSLDPEALRNIRSCVDETDLLLSQFLELARLEWGLVTPSVAEFRIEETLRRVVSQREAEARRKGLSLRWVPSKLVANTDEELLRCCLRCLLDHALRNTERGGVLVGCRRRKGRIKVEVWHTAPCHQEETFEALLRVGSDGAVGLAIVARTAALLDLQVAVHCRRGKGSVFSVELPTGRTLEKSMPERDDKPGAGRGLRVALVDDHPAVRESVAFALETFGHEIIAAGGGAELYAALDSAGKRPDIVVSDYDLAWSETGCDVISALRGLFGEELPAIVMTGNTDRELVCDMAERRIAVLHKPFDPKTLHAQMEALAWRSEADPD